MEHMESRMQDVIEGGMSANDELHARIAELEKALRDIRSYVSYVASHSGVAKTVLGLLPTEL